MKKFSEILVEVTTRPLLTILNPEDGQTLSAKCIAVNRFDIAKSVLSKNPEDNTPRTIVFDRFAKFNVRSEYQAQKADALLEELCEVYETSGDFDVENEQLNIIRACLTKDIPADVEMPLGANVKLTLNTYHPKHEVTREVMYDVISPAISWVDVVEVKATTTSAVSNKLIAALAKAKSAEAEG